MSLGMHITAGDLERDVYEVVARFNHSKRSILFVRGKDCGHDHIVLVTCRTFDEGGHIEKVMGTLSLPPKRLDDLIAAASKAREVTR